MWWGRRRAENVFQDPLSAEDRRRAIRIRSHGQDAALAKQTHSGLIRQRDTTEAASVNVRNPIMPRQPLIHERVIGIDEIEDAAVFAHDAVEKQFGLAPERL